MMRTAILVVSYNAADLLLKTLDRIPPEIVDRVEEIVVFDDHSTDLSFDSALAYKSRRSFDKLKVFRNPRNRGYGGNQKRGYQYVLRRGFDAVVLLHGDGQYAPERLQYLLDPLEHDEADCVIASRMMPGCRPLAGGMPLYKYWGNRVLTFLQNRLTGMGLSEFHSGYRAYRCSALRNLPLSHDTDSWHFDTQILLQLKGNGFRIREISIPTFYGDEISRVNGISYAIHCVWECVEFRLAKWGLRMNPLYVEAAPGYEFHEDLQSSHRTILDLIPSAAPLKILDVGVATGYLERELQARGHSVTGIEPNPEWAAEARGYCHELLEGSVESLDLSGSNEKFDCVVMADVLEHLADPKSALEKVIPTLKPEGRAIISIPNFANLYVRLLVLFGLFSYQPKGILDATHLRFFTLRSIRLLVEEAGLEILSVRVTPLPMPHLFPRLSRQAWFRRFCSGLDRVTRMLPGLLAYQFILEVEKPAWRQESAPPEGSRKGKDTFYSVARSGRTN
jgi:glycosyltransferase involved in cell wall biosynthesis